MTELPAYIPPKDELRSRREELIWLAGILDGEGSFYLGESRGKLYPVVQVEMTDADIVDEIARLFDGRPCSVYRYTDPRPRERLKRYRTRLGWARARDFMIEVAPFLGERRRAKIAEILETLDG